MEESTFCNICFKMQNTNFSTIVCVASFQASWPSCAKAMGKLLHIRKVCTEKNCAI